MSKRKYHYEFTEYRQYKCCLCGRTMYKPTPHICNRQYIKHKLIFMKKDEEKVITKEEIRKASREYAMKKSKEKNTYFVDYKDIEEAFLEGAYFAFAYSVTSSNTERRTDHGSDN